MLGVDEVILNWVNGIIVIEGDLTLLAWMIMVGSIRSILSLSHSPPTLPTDLLNPLQHTCLIVLAFQTEPIKSNGGWCWHRLTFSILVLNPVFLTIALDIEFRILNYWKNHYFRVSEEESENWESWKEVSVN